MGAGAHISYGSTGLHRFENFEKDFTMNNIKIKLKVYLLEIPLDHS